jgi:hypothetical protein
MHQARSLDSTDDLSAIVCAYPVCSTPKSPSNWHGARLSRRERRFGLLFAQPHARDG